MGENSKVRIITEEEVGNIDITQVLMPVMGGFTRLPQNETKNLYSEFFEENALDQSVFKALVNQWRVEGSYRPIIIRPEKFEYTIKRYNSDEDCLLKNRPFFEGDEEKYSSETLGKLLALVLKFRLPN